MLAILATIDPGDEAIFLDPYFVMYKHLLTMAGGKPVIVDSYPDFRFHADRVEQAITPQDQAADPQLAEQPDRRRDERGRGARRGRVARKHDLLILSDEIYEPFLYDGVRERVQSESRQPASVSLDCTRPPRAATYEKTISSAASPRATR